MAPRLPSSPPAHNATRVLLTSIFLSAACAEPHALGGSGLIGEPSGASEGSSSDGSTFGDASESTGDGEDSVGTGGGSGSQEPVGEFHPQAQVGRNEYNILKEGMEAFDPFLPSVDIGLGKNGGNAYLARVMPFLDEEQQALIEGCRLLLRSCSGHPLRHTGNATLFQVVGSWNADDNWQTIWQAVEDGSITLNPLAAIPHPSPEDKLTDPLEVLIDGDVCREWIQQSPEEGYSFLIAADEPDMVVPLQIGTPACFPNPSLPVLWFDLK